MSKVQGIVMYAKPHKADNYGKYTVNLIVDEAAIKQIQNDNLGHIIKKISDIKPEYQQPYVDLAGGLKFYAQFKRDAVDKNGKPLPNPKVADAKGQEFSDLIGNGSLGEVYYHAQKYTVNGGGYKCVWDGLQVLDLVPFGEPVVNFEVQEGFSQEAEVGMNSAMQPE